MRKNILSGIFLLALLSGPAFAQGRYRQMDITAGGGLGEGQVGFNRLENTSAYSLGYSYWLNDTSTLDVNISYLMSQYRVVVKEAGEPKSETLPDWTSLIGTVGVRYQPAWDFFLDFGFGAGLGYEGWWIKSDVFNNRNGDSPIYYLLMDVEYPIQPWLSVGLYAEPFYYPLNERLEKRADIDPAGNVYLDYDKLANSWIVIGGAWVKVRIY